MSERKSEKDAFEVYQESCLNAIEEFTRLQAQYTQSVSSLQQESIDAAKKLTTTTITVAKELAGNTWGQSKFPSAIAKAASDSTEALLKTATVNNKAFIAGIDAVRQNISVFNDNLESFTKMNLNLIKTWQTLFTLPRM